MSTARPDTLRGVCEEGNGRGFRWRGRDVPKEYEDEEDEYQDATADDEGERDEAEGEYDA